MLKSCETSYHGFLKLNVCIKVNNVHITSYIDGEQMGVDLKQQLVVQS